MVYHGYQQATRSGKIKLFASNSPKYKAGEQLRDFVYVDDIVSTYYTNYSYLALMRKSGESKLFYLKMESFKHWQRYRRNLE